MAVTTLSPWPTSMVALQNARTCLKEAIGSDADDATIDRLGGTAAALVERFAASAPQAVKDESVIRVSGWLSDVPHAGLTKLDVGGGISLMFDRDRTRSALRLSGAKALLAPWRSPGAALVRELPDASAPDVTL